MVFCWITLGLAVLVAVITVLSVAVGLGWRVAGLPVETTGHVIFGVFVVVILISAVIAHRAALSIPVRKTETTRHHP